MGASDISFQLNKKATKAEISAAFTRQRDDDADENGRAGGYSGDFQTVNSVDFQLDKIFPNESEAMDYCLDKASKWETVVAVYFNHTQPVKNKTIDKMYAKIKILLEEYNKLYSLPLDKTKPFKTRTQCKSRLSLAHVKGYHCPVCDMSLRPTALRNKINGLSTKMDVLKGKIVDIQKKEEEKQAAKATNVQTLVAGWGAS